MKPYVESTSTKHYKTHQSAKDICRSLLEFLVLHRNQQLFKQAYIELHHLIYLCAHIPHSLVWAIKSRIFKFYENTTAELVNIILDR